MAIVPRTGKRGSPWTEEEALDWYRRAKEAKGGERVGFDDMVPYQGSFAALFGSISEFQRRGGDTPGKPGRPKTKKSIRRRGR